MHPFFWGLCVAGGVIVAFILAKLIGLDTPF